MRSPSVRRLVTEPTIEARGVRRSCEIDDSSAALRRSPSAAVSAFDACSTSAILLDGNGGLLDEGLQRRDDRIARKHRRSSPASMPTTPIDPSRARHGPEVKSRRRQRIRAVARPAPASRAPIAPPPNPMSRADRRVASPSRIERPAPRSSSTTDLPLATAATWLANSQSTSSSFGAPESLREKSNSACVASARSRVAVACSLRRPGERAGHEGDGEENEERQQLVRLGDREGVARVDEEEIVGKEREDRRRQSPRSAEAHAAEQHREQEHHREVRQLRDLLKRQRRASTATATAHAATASDLPSDRSRQAAGGVKQRLRASPAVPVPRSERTGHWRARPDRATGSGRRRRTERSPAFDRPMTIWVMLLRLA